MSDEDPEEKSDAVDEDDERPREGGFIWTTTEPDLEPPADRCDCPSRPNEVTSEEPTHPEGDGRRDRIWDQLGGDSDDPDGTTEATDVREYPIQEGPERRSSDDDARRGRIWDSIITDDATEAPEQSGSSGDEPGEERQTERDYGESADVRPREPRQTEDAKFRQFGSEAYRPAAGHRDSASADDTATYDGWPTANDDDVDEDGAPPETQADPVGSVDETPPTADTEHPESFARSVNRLEYDSFGPCVLVVGPDDLPAIEKICAGFIDSASTDDVGVLFVTFDQTAAERTTVFRHLPDAHWGPVAAIEVGVYGQVSSPIIDRGTTEGSDEITIKRISDPTNVSKLGILISKLVSELNPTERTVVLCFHSITELATHVENKQLFRFLHILTGLLSNHDVRAHLHLDPAESSHLTVRTIAPLFDSVLHLSPEGDVEVE